MSADNTRFCAPRKYTLRPKICPILPIVAFFANGRIGQDFGWNAHLQFGVFTIIYSGKERTINGKNIIGGRGFYQEKGKPARELKAGDIVEIAPNVVHWHGAAPDSWFSHLAIECKPDANKNTWLEPVSDEEYERATSGK